MKIFPFAAPRKIVLLLAGLAMFAQPLSAAPANETGIASRYSELAKTASGMKVTARDMVAAHRTLRFGTRVVVKSLATGKSVTVTIVDRGPFIAGRIIDLSSGAADVLGFSGLERVQLTVVE